MSSSIEVSLLNRFNEPIVYLPDGPQELFLDVRNISGMPLSMGADANPPATPDIMFLMRPRVAKVVANQDPLTLTAVTMTDGATEKDVLAGWKLSAKDAANRGLLSISLTASPKLDMNPNARLRIGFSIDPDATSGARLSRVELRYLVTLYHSPDPPHPFAGTELLQLNLVDISRKGFEAAVDGQAVTSVVSGPFEAAFLGSNVIVNDGITSNTLRIRVNANRSVVSGSSGLTLGANSALNFTFDEADAVQPWGIRVKEDVGPGKAADPALALECTNDVWAFTGLSGKPKLPNAIFSSTLDLTVTVISKAQSGYTPLRIEYKNIPGYADGVLALFCQLGPIFVVDDTTKLLSNAEPFSHASALAISQPLQFAGTGLRKPDGTLSGTPPSIGLSGDNSSLRISAANLSMDVAGNFQLGPANSPHLTIDAGAGVSVRLQGDVKITVNAAGDATVLTLTNNHGGPGTGTALDFNTYAPTPGKNPSARIEAVDAGSYTNDIRFLVNQAGAAGNGLVERLRIASDGSVLLDQKLKIASDGNGSLFLNGNKPFVVKTWSVLQDNPDIHTGFKAAEYTAILAGFQGTSAHGPIYGATALPQTQNGEWVISCRLQQATDQEFDIFVLFIRNEMVDNQSFFKI